MATKQQFRKGKLYRFTGIRWDQRMGTNQAYDVIVIGELARSTVDPLRRERDCKGEFQPDDAVYRIDDGHLPEHQPRVRGRDLPSLMGPQKVRFAYPDYAHPYAPKCPCDVGVTCPPNWLSCSRRAAI